MNSTLTPEDVANQRFTGDEEFQPNDEKMIELKPPEILSISQVSAYNNFPVSMSNNGR